MDKGGEVFTYQLPSVIDGGLLDGVGENGINSSLLASKESP